MRIPLTPVVDSRDGSSDKDARMSNALKETENGSDFACVRPALTLITNTTGNGNGVSYLDTLISVFGDKIRYSESLTLFTTIDDGKYDFVRGDS